MTIKDSEGIVYLNEEQYTLLKLNGKLVIDGITIEYSPLTTSYAVKDTRTLLAPKAAPLQNQIVAVNEEGKQRMLNVGDGLSIENDTLKASGGSSGGGSKLYQHVVSIFNASLSSHVCFNLFNHTSTPMETYLTVAETLYDSGFIGHLDDSGINLRGVITTALQINENNFSIMIYSTDGINLYLYGNNQYDMLMQESDVYLITDYVIEL